MFSSLNKVSIHKFFIYYLLYAVTLPLLLLGGTSLLISSGMLRDEIDQAETRNVKLISDNIERYLSEPLNDLYLIKELIEKDEFNNTNLIKDVLAYILQTKDNILGIEIADSSGKILFVEPYNETLIGNDISGYSYYKNIRKNVKPYWSPTFMSEQLDTPVTTLSIPMKNGIVTAVLSLKNINSITYNGEGFGNSRTFIVTDQKGVYISHPDINRVILREYDPIFRESKNQWKGKGLSRVYEYEGVKYLSYVVFIEGINWMVALYQPLEALYSPIKIMAILLVLLTIIFTGISILFGNILRIGLTKSINQLLKATEVIAGGHYEVFIPKVKFLELISLSESIERMAMVIRSREGKLTQARDELSRHRDNLEMEVKSRTVELTESLNSLKLAQNKLVESEKMAYLGGLVAGVAHEINTPIGIIVSASSYLEEKTKKFIDDYEGNKISHNVFKKYCEEALKSTKLLLSNSFRASNLIKSFKQVAVDQSSEHKRSFNIKEYIGEVLASSHSILKGKDINLNIESPDKIVMDSYPGAFAQVLTNLLNNSMKHGFEKMNEGEIYIEIEDKGESIKIKYSDNGKGMDQDTLNQIFDPFFTTKRGKGGSGLGMHIVYNLVTQTLKGSINCTSSNGNGVEIDMVIPKNI